jgi:hypothetical protein
MNPEEYPSLPKAKFRAPPLGSPPVANSNFDKKTPVTIEDLLRFKRNEQPPSEFWQQFDRELREKQLAAIVAKRPWWTPLARYSGLVSRYQLPIGAAAALAVALAGFHEYRAYVPARPSVNSAQNAAASLPERTEVAVSGTESRSPVISEEHPKLAMAPESRAVATAAAYHESENRQTAAPVRIDARSLALGAGSETDDSLSARWIAANLSAAQAAEPEVIRNLLGLSHSLDARIIPAVHSRAEPLEQMSSPSAERRSRLLGGVVPALATYGEATVPVSDRVVNELSDDRLYQSVSRYAAGADYLSIKVKF